jgi:hypothetical protein
MTGMCSNTFTAVIPQYESVRGVVSDGHPYGDPERRAGGRPGAA